jgi:hypothetical protein
MPDEGVRHTTLRAFIRTGENQTRTTFNILVDKASKLGYNDHALQPGSKDAAKHDPLSRAVPFSGMKDRAYTIPEQTKRPSPMDGLMNDDGKYRQAIQPRQAGSLSNKPDGDSVGCNSPICRTIS